MCGGGGGGGGEGGGGEGGENFLFKYELICLPKLCKASTQFVTGREC